MLVISNAFSISMLKDYEQSKVKFRKVKISRVRKLIRENPVDMNMCKSIIGHEGTAEVFAKILKSDLKPNREFYSLKYGDVLIVGSLNARLPEGKVLTASELREIPIEWYEVTLGVFRKVKDE